MTTASKYILAKILSNGDATVKANLPEKMHPWTDTFRYESSFHF